MDPCATVRMLKECEAIHVRGNGDRMVFNPECRNPSKSALFARGRLSIEDLAFAATWPAIYQEEGWLACHGSPRSDTEYLLEEVRHDGVSIRNREKITAILGKDYAPLVLCGHTHIPRVVYLPNGCTIVNPGSIGLPAYYDDLPAPHKMETGSPHARYAIVEGAIEQLSVSIRVVPYDWEKAALTAARNGFPEWLHALQTGYV